MTSHPILCLTLHEDAPADAAGSVVREAAVSTGVRPERATRVRTVVEELVREARERECAAGDADVTVTLRRSGAVLHVEVTDLRIPLDRNMSSGLQSRRLAALRFVDSLHISSEGVRGNLARCEVGIDVADLEALEAAEVHDEGVERVDDATAASVQVRTMTPDDAAGVARCVYRCYGYSYTDPLMYSTRGIRHVVRDGLSVASVAVDCEGEVVGHNAATYERHGDRVPEAGRLVVDPRFRGHHLAERLAAHRLELMHTAQVPGMWSEAVTNHPYSQKEVVNSGGVETGLLLDATPASVHMAGLSNVEGQRHALLAFWITVTAAADRELHLPERHHLLLSTLADRAGLVRHLSGAGAEPPSSARTTVSTTLLSTGVHHLRLTRIGSDLRGRILAEIQASEAAMRQGAQVCHVMHLDVPLWDPAAPWCIAELESVGFSWGAWVPEFSADGDVLRLQRVPDCSVDPATIQCARAEGEAMRDHVLAERDRVERRRSRV